MHEAALADSSQWHNGRCRGRGSAAAHVRCCAYSTAKRSPSARRWGSTACSAATVWARSRPVVGPAECPPPWPATARSGWRECRAAPSRGGPRSSRPGSTRVRRSGQAPPGSSPRPGHETAAGAHRRRRRWPLAHRRSAGGSPLSGRAPNGCGWVIEWLHTPCPALTIRRTSVGYRAGPAGRSARTWRAPRSRPAGQPAPVARNAAHVTRPADTRGAVHRAGRAVGRCSSRSSSAGGVVVGERPGRASGVAGGCCSGAGTRRARLRRAAG